MDWGPQESGANLRISVGASLAATAYDATIFKTRSPQATPLQLNLYDCDYSNVFSIPEDCYFQRRANDSVLVPIPILPMSIAQNMKLFDFQVNGFAGIDFQSESLSLAEMQQAAAGLEKHRMSAVFFTLITDDVDALCRKFENIESICASDERIASMIRGYHLEGPWLSRETGYCGAHPIEHVCQAKLGDYRKMRDAAGGRLKLITLAPEVEGGLEIVETAVSEGIRIALGHTNASEEVIDQAIGAGATLATHVGNGVPAEMDRHDNIIQRLLARDELIACFIPDGIHLPPFVLKNFYRAKPNGKSFFTTDCMAAAGAPPGTYRIGPHQVEVGSDGIVHLPGDQRFAGSSLTLDRGVENISKWLDIEMQEAMGMCSTLPAAHFGIEL